MGMLKHPEHQSDRTLAGTAQRTSLEPRPSHVSIIIWCNDDHHLILPQFKQLNIRNTHFRANTIDSSGGVARIFKGWGGGLYSHTVKCAQNFSDHTHFVAMHSN